MNERNGSPSLAIGGDPRGPASIDAHQLIRQTLGKKQALVKTASIRVSLELNARERQVLGDAAAFEKQLGDLFDEVVARASAGDAVVVRTTSTDDALRVEIVRGEDDVAGFEMPARASGIVSALPPSGAAPEGARRVLVVDDDPDTVALLCRALERRGYAVESAGTVADALAALDAASFDAVLCDMRLPDGTGANVLGAASRRPPAIALTGSSAPDDVEALRAAGFVEHLVKPVPIATLEAALTRLLANS